ncbi:hypothetical protein KDM41_06110 [bacterium]|nr:hypothetical protein [bacterium]
MRRACGIRLVAVLALLAVWPTLARAEARLVDVEPVLGDEQLQCRLHTAGLPGAKQLQSMQSGLEASVELNLALVDEGERLLAGRTVSLRMAFDLWDEVFSVRADGRERRFTELSDLKAYLAELGGLVVAPAALLAPDGRYRVQVDMVVHAVAPDEQQRVEDVIVGDGRPRREGQDQQEASVSLGRLIRIFYKGGGDDRAGHALASAWFRGGEVRP